MGDLPGARHTRSARAVARRRARAAGKSGPRIFPAGGRLRYTDPDTGQEYIIDSTIEGNDHGDRE